MEAVLSTRRDNTERLDRLADELRLTPALTPHLIARVLGDACTRVPSLAGAGKTAAFDRLVRAEAWTDAALSLVELELPMWRLRRLVNDSGEWLCSLSRHPNVPIEFDELAEAQHEARPVAIMLSFIEAKRLFMESEHVSAPSVPQAGSITAHPFCCDNFR
jgi:hypothetical protein